MTQSEREWVQEGWGNGADDSYYYHSYIGSLQEFPRLKSSNRYEALKGNGRTELESAAGETEKGEQQSGAEEERESVAPENKTSRGDRTNQRAAE